MGIKCHSDKQISPSVRPSVRFLVSTPLESPHIMGEFTIGTSMTMFVWIVSMGIIAVNLYIVGGFLVDEGNSAKGGGGWLYACVGIGGCLYLTFILFLMWPDFVKLKRHACSFFLKLGGYDEVGRYDVFPDSPGSLQGGDLDMVGGGRLGLRGGLTLDNNDDDDSSELLGPQSSGQRSLSGVGEDYAPVSRVVGFNEGGGNDHRYNGVGQHPSGARDGGSSPAAASTLTAGTGHRGHEAKENDSRA